MLKQFLHFEEKEVLPILYWGFNFKIPIEFFIWQLNGELSVRMSTDKEKLKVLTFPWK